MRLFKLKRPNKINRQPHRNVKKNSNQNSRLFWITSIRLLTTRSRSSVFRLSVIGKKRIFSWLSWLAVLLVGAHRRRRIDEIEQHCGHTLGYRLTETCNPDHVNSGNRTKWSSIRSVIIRVMNKRESDLLRDCSLFMAKGGGRCLEGGGVKFSKSMKKEGCFFKIQISGEG